MKAALHHPQEHTHAWRKKPRGWSSVSELYDSEGSGKPLSTGTKPHKMKSQLFLSGCVFEMANSQHLSSATPGWCYMRHSFKETIKHNSV